MLDDNTKRRAPWWMLILVGGFVGGFCGFWAGGGTTLAFCLASVALEGGNPPIILVVVYAVFGAALYGIAGAFLGAIWPLLPGPPWRLTIARLMWIIALVALSLPPLLADPWDGGIVLASTLMVLPMVIASLVATDRRSARLVDRPGTDA
jgi:hypothetical protein